jgi:integrase
MAIFKRPGRRHYVMDFVFRGIKVCRSTGKTTEREALQVELEARQAIERELLSTPHEKSMDLLMSAAIDRITAERWSENKDGKLTEARMRSLLTMIGDRPLGSLSYDHIIKARQELRRSGRSKGTCNRYMAGLKTLLREAHLRWRCLPVMPEVPMYPEKKKGRIYTYTPEVESAITTWLREDTPIYASKPFSPHLADLFEVLIDTGMRLSEALQGTYGREYKLDQGIIDLSPENISLKSDAPRVIPMTSRVLGILRRRQAEYPRQPFPYDKSTCSKHFKRVKAGLGITEPEACLHACRHTCLTRLLQAGLDIETVRVWAGHSSITVTQRYVHTDTSKLHEAAEALEKFGVGKHLRVVRKVG